MKILSINAGSSSLKFKMYEMPEEKVLISGLIEKIGKDANYKIITDKIYEEKAKTDNHEDAAKLLIKSLFDYNIIDSLDEIKAIGHRIVNGKDHFLPEVVDDNTIQRLKNISELSKVHMQGHIAGIKAFKKLAPNIPQVLNYDTAFHHTIKEENYLYPVPYEWYQMYSVRKFGFHGISAKYITQKLEHKLNKKVNLIICHIGNGASITAVKGSKSLDNSMGFTANAGLIMGTRCGDIDYSIIPYIAKKLNYTIDQIDDVLNNKSGLEGYVKGANDNRDLEKAINNGDPKAKLIFEMYANKVVDYIAKYYLMLDDIDAIVFTAGVGENNVAFRKKVLQKLEKLGIILDEEKNKNVNKYGKEEGIITNENSKIPCIVMKTDEEIMIARDTLAFIEKGD